MRKGERRTAGPMVGLKTVATAVEEAARSKYDPIESLASFE